MRLYSQVLMNHTQLFSPFRQILHSFQLQLNHYTVYAKAVSNQFLYLKIFLAILLFLPLNHQLLLWLRRLTFLGVRNFHIP